MNDIFYGYPRLDGRAGTRNYVALIASVICSTTPVTAIAREVEGAIPVVHQYGCAQVGDDMSQTKRTLAGVAINPNVAGVLVVGLGCESNQAEAFAATLPRSKPIEVIGIQELGGTEQTIRRGVEIARRLGEQAGREERQPVRLSGLSLGVLGVEADEATERRVYPAVGALIDRLVGEGAQVTVGLSHALAPEGGRLAERAATGVAKERLEKIGDGLLRRRWLAVSGSVEASRPWTDDERAKAGREAALTGSAPIQSVVTYAETPKGSGLHLMTVPSSPVEAFAGLVAGGANLILVASSRGLFSGVVACPTLVVAPASERKSAFDELVDCWIEGDDPAAGAERILAALVRTASGEKTAAESQHLDEFAISQLGTPF